MTEKVELPFDVTSLGDLLHRLFLVDDDTLISALRRQRSSGGLLGQVLVAMGAITSADVEKALAMQKDLRGENPLAALERLMQEQVALRERMNRRAFLQTENEGA